jgi:hypothetical protein
MPQFPTDSGQPPARLNRRPGVQGHLMTTQSLPYQTLLDPNTFYSPKGSIEVPPYEMHQYIGVRRPLYKTGKDVAPIDVPFSVLENMRSRQSQLIPF